MFACTAALLSAALLILPMVARASDPFLVRPPDDVLLSAPAYRYAHMSEPQALADLERRGIAFERVGSLGRVRTPVRLLTALRGVSIHSTLPQEQRETSLFEVCDARLALALDDFALLLASHDIVEVVHYTMYRPGLALQDPATPDVGPEIDEVTLQGFAKTVRASGTSGKKPTASANPAHSSPHRRAPAAPRAESSASAPVRTQAPSKGGKHRQRQRPSVQRPAGSSNSRHPDGLAIDVGAFRKRDGTWLSVGVHFGGRIGQQTCGAGSKAPQPPAARELWEIVCEAYDQKIFTYVLTPNFDLPHQDHFHMEIKPGVPWFLYH